MSVTTIENLCIYYTFIYYIGFIAVYTCIWVAALAALSSFAALGVVTLTPPGASVTAGLSSRKPTISVLHFCVYFDKASHFITSSCFYRTDDIYVCICHTPVPRFYCVHKSHYHFYCVHNDILQHVLCIWCCHFLLYFVRNDENRDDQSISNSNYNDNDDNDNNNITITITMTITITITTTAATTTTITITITITIWW